MAATAAKPLEPLLEETLAKARQVSGDAGRVAGVLREAGFGSWTWRSRRRRADGMPMEAAWVADAVRALAGPERRERSEADVEAAVGLAEVLWWFAVANGGELPRMVRIEMVMDAEDFLTSPLIREKPLLEKMQFLMRKGVTKAELARALATVGVDPSEEEWRRGTRFLRTDMMDNALIFLRSELVQDRSLAERFALLREKGLTEDELGEALDLCPDVVEAAAKREMSKAAAVGAAASSPAPVATKSSGNTGAEKPDLDKAVRFLTSAAAKTADAAAVDAFLRKQGFSDADVAAARAKVAAAPPAQSPPTSLEEFVKQPAFASRPIDERRAFLKARGVTDAAVERLLGGSSSSATTSTSTSKSGFLDLSQLHPEVAKAIAFLNHPAVQDKTIDERAAFLQSQGIPADRIAEAVQLFSQRARQGLGRNLTAAASPAAAAAPTPRNPNDAVQTLRHAVETLANVLVADANSVDPRLLAAVCAFLTAAVRASNSTFGRLPPSVVTRAWDAVGRARVLLGPSPHASFEALACETLELAASVEFVTAVKLDAAMIFADALRLLAPATSVDAGMALASAVHGHFVARASVAKAAMALEPVLKGVAESRGRAKSYLLAALWRGGYDFGWGLLSPAARVASAPENPTNRVKSMLVEHLAAAALEKDAVSCFASVYSQLVDERLVPALCVALFHGSLAFAGVLDAPAETEEEELASVASKSITPKLAFKLAATAAQSLVKAVGVGSSDTRMSVLRAASERTREMHDASRGVAGLRSSLAMKMLKRAYDPASAAKPLPEVLGTSGELGKLFQTAFLVMVVVCEPTASGVSLVDAEEAALEAWSALARLGFALVPVPDAMKLHKWCREMASASSAASSSAATRETWRVAAAVVGKVVGANVLLQRDSKADEDWVRGAALEYALDTSSAFVVDDDPTLGWCEAPHDDADASALVQAMVAGSSHAFVHLHKRCHAWLTDAFLLEKKRVGGGEVEVEAAREEEEPEEQPRVLMACVPWYLERAAASCGRTTDAQTMGFGVATVLLALGRNPNALALPVSVMGFAKLTDAVREEVVVSGMRSSSDTKRTTDLVLTTFAALKAVSQGALPQCLDRVRSLFEFVAFREVAQGRGVGVDGLRLADLKLKLFHVVSRMDDAPRRALLAVWFVTRIRGIGGAATVLEDHALGGGKL